MVMFNPEGTRFTVNGEDVKAVLRPVRLGDAVTYMYGKTPCLAFITDPQYEVDGRVEQALVVFPPNEQSFTTVAPYNPTPAGGTWAFLYE